MGCCLSRSPTTYPGASSSSQAIANASRPQSRSAPIHRPLTNESVGSHRNLVASSSHRPLDQRINQPLRPHIWASKDTLWTRRELDRERIEFFDTRTSGRQEIWQAINAALDVMWKGGDDADEDGGVATAQSILDAAGVTIPKGDLARGVYDALGHNYKLPEWVVSDPTNIKVDDAEDAKGDEEVGVEDESTDEDVRRRRELKGKAKAKDMINVRARFQDVVHGDLVFPTGKDDTVRVLVKMIAQKLELSPPKHVKLAYMGKLLKDNLSLFDQGWVEGHIVNAWVLSSRPDPPSNSKTTTKSNS